MCIHHWCLKSLVSKTQLNSKQSSTQIQKQRLFFESNQIRVLTNATKGSRDSKCRATQKARCSFFQIPVST